MIRIDLTRQNINSPDHSKRHPSRASCEVGGRRYETTGPAPIYKLSTLLWLHGHGGEEYEVWDDRDPFGNPGGLALRGQARNWASFKTPKGAPMFRMKSQPEPNFTPEQRVIVAEAAGIVVSCDADSRETPSPGRATRPLDGPEHQTGPESPSTGIACARAPKAA